MSTKQVIVLYCAKIRCHLGIVCTLRNNHLTPTLDHTYTRLWETLLWLSICLAEFWVLFFYSYSFILTSPPLFSLFFFLLLFPKSSWQILKFAGLTLPKAWYWTFHLANSEASWTLTPKLSPRLTFSSSGSFSICLFLHCLDPMDMMLCKVTQSS